MAGAPAEARTDTALTPALAIAMVKAASDTAELLFPAPADGEI
ncbi:hypothetical protein [Streptomyces angustmyceticus]